MCLAVHYADGGLVNFCEGNATANILRFHFFGIQIAASGRAAHFSEYVITWRPRETLLCDRYEVGCDKYKGSCGYSAEKYAYCAWQLLIDNLCTCLIAVLLSAGTNLCDQIPKICF